MASVEIIEEFTDPDEMTASPTYAIPRSTSTPQHCRRSFVQCPSTAAPSTTGVVVDTKDTQVTPPNVPPKFMMQTTEAHPNKKAPPTTTMTSSICKSFWKAGDYEGHSSSTTLLSSSLEDHVRVHPRFLHSNATSHTWALGALAELLDNAMDEVSHGATFVNIDMLVNQKDELGSKMLVVEDDGGGMDPACLRRCISLGFSEKTKSMANTIGRYGNGFNTSTMRLGADVIVFTRSPGKEKEGDTTTQSIGLLSYTFLMSTGKQDIVVPMVDYKRRNGVGGVWNKLMIRSSSSSSPDAAWNDNLETILKWSPYHNESDLLRQFSSMADRCGTRIVIYNLWEDDEGELELDFDTDSSDIQIRRGVKDKIRMAEQYPSSRHFFTYTNSLRSYASMLYLRIPHGFRMVLRGREIEHHRIVDDMMLKQEVSYRPITTRGNVEGVSKDGNTVAVVTIGFVKDAKDHIDVQGFNVYHKNRLIKPFWRVWSAAGSGGRGIIGVVEADFVEPAHDKQGFECTAVLSRLEMRLQSMQKTYWAANAHQIGYAPKHKMEVTTLFEAPKRKREATDVEGCRASSGGGGAAEQNTTIRPQSQAATTDYYKLRSEQLAEDNNRLKERIKRRREFLLRELQLEKDKFRTQQSMLAETNSQQKGLNPNRVKEDLRQHMKNAAAVIQELVQKRNLNKYIKPEPAEEDGTTPERTILPPLASSSTAMSQNRHTNLTQLEQVHQTGTTMARNTHPNLTLLSLIQLQQPGFWF